MSTETNIKTIEQDSNSLYKTQKIKFTSSKSILTPTKTIPLDHFKLMHPINKKASQLNEVFKRFNSEQINKCLEDSDKYSEIESWFNSQKNKHNDDSSTFCFIDYNEQKLPTEEEIEFMTEVAYCNSDITTIPTINHFNTKQEEISYEDYKQYLSQAIEIIEQLNNKPIMGIIPKLAPKKVSDLLDFYNSKGINSFALDLDGSNPISSSMRIFRVLKTLNKSKILDNSYIHGHNVGMRVNKTVDVIPAKDVLGFGVGLNSLGEKRKVFRPNRAFLNFIKTNPMNKFRLFNKKDYGYWKGITTEELAKVFPKDCTLPLKNFSNIKQASYLQKRFNSEQLALESVNIRNRISEEADKSLDYIKRKKYVLSDDIKVLEKGSSKIK